MAKQDFLTNFRVARNLFYHGRVYTDTSHLDSTALEDMLGRAAIWLTPKSVSGFEPKDFSELGPGKRAELENAVKDFLRVAKKVPPDKPATAEQLRNAKSAFAKILSILEPYLPSREEGKLIEQVLSKILLPDWAVNWDYEFGSDEDGAPAVWINLFVDENLAPRKELARVASQMTADIRKALSDAGNSRWPYIRIRTAAEHKTA